MARQLSDREQVLVAARPGETPEVYLTCLDVAKKQLTFRKASVLDSGDVSLGSEWSIKLTDAGAVDVSNDIVAVLDPRGQLLAQLHLEDAEDLGAWVEGIKHCIPTAGGGGRAATGKVPSSPGSRQNPPPTESDGDEEVLLKARSQQLQNKIGDLEAVGERRDKQLQKLMKRLDGAMQMLQAVQDMCDQQRKVIDAQQVAIQELRKECHGPDSGRFHLDQAEESPTSSGAQSPGPHVPPAPPATPAVLERETEEEEDEEEQGDQAQQMMALLQQAMEMQKLMSGLEALGATEGPSSPSRGAGSAANGAAVAAEGGEEDSVEAVLGRLQALQAEKEKFEGMLRDSQSEHEQLLERIVGMRALMEQLGIREEDLMGDEEEEGEQ